MRITAFPGGDGPPPDEAWVAELEAALSGESHGTAAESWRELRADVRALAPPMTPAFEQRLREELQLRSARSRRLPAARWLRALGGPRVVAAGASIAVLAVLVVAALAPFATHRPPEAVPAAGGPVAGAATRQGNAEAARVHSDLAPVPGVSSPVAGGSSAASSAAAPGRVQQLAASISLSASPADVQTVSDAVGQLAVRDEGFVESSHVQVQQHGSSEAVLSLRLPSARLSAALAAIGRLAPVSAESQSLQDITDTYDAARQRLSDATAERQALLRALAAATTEGRIDSLRERLAQARGAIAGDRSALRAVSQRASTAEVEVTVLGDASASSEGLTLRRGLHDALRVLTVALIVLLIAAAALVPLALVIALLAGAGRVWRRGRRERALEAS